jgi:hypothetical protein
MPKRLELLSELVPRAGVIALLVNPNDQAVPDRVGADREDDRDRRGRRFRRSAEGMPPPAAIRSTLRPTRSAANAGSRS